MVGLLPLHARSHIALLKLTCSPPSRYGPSSCEWQIWHFRGTFSSISPSMHQKSLKSINHRNPLFLVFEIREGFVLSLCPIIGHDQGHLQ